MLNIATAMSRIMRNLNLIIVKNEAQLFDTETQKCSLIICVHITYLMFCLRYAEQVTIGDEVLAEVKNDLIPEKVMNVSSSKMQGKHHTLKLTKFLDLFE